MPERSPFHFDLHHARIRGTRHDIGAGGSQSAVHCQASVAHRWGGIAWRVGREIAGHGATGLAGCRNTGIGH